MTEETTKLLENDREIALIKATAEIVAAAATRATLSAGEIRELVGATKEALAAPTGKTEVKVEAQKPAVDPKKSIKDDAIICLEDGKPFKSLKRHLMTHYSLTPDQYREKWGLPASYPMVAPGYAAKRSELAKAMGLGRKPKAGNTRKAA
ncbi:MAG: MucR family transcriptional regulator [Mesorhizobium sp.]